MEVALQPSLAALPTVAVMADLNEAIEQAQSPHELLVQHLRAETIRKLAIRHKNVELQYQASRAKLMSERRLGEMLRELQRLDREEDRRSRRGTFGGQFVGKTPYLPEGVSKQQAERWRTLSELPEPEFDAWVDIRIAADEELTQRSLLAVAEAFIAQKKREQERKGCGGASSEDDVDDDDDDDDDVDDVDEDEDEDEDNSAYIRPIQFHVTAAEHQEILADLPMMQAFFDTDNRSDTLMVMWRHVRRAIQEEQE